METGGQEKRRREALCYDVGEYFNNEGTKFAAVSFSVPDDVKQAGRETFANENRSAVIARLMQQAVEDKKRQQRRAAAVEALLNLRRKQRPFPAR